MDVCVCSVCVYSVSTPCGGGKNTSTVIPVTYHWISLFKSYIETAN
jgi:hypothetical protein